MISCDQHDYIEIACLYQYNIKITMKIGDIIECTALDTQYNASREECIKVNVKGVAKELVLSEISKIEACVENPFFKEIFIA